MSSGSRFADWVVLSRSATLMSVRDYTRERQADHAHGRKTFSYEGRCTKVGFHFSHIMALAYQNLIAAAAMTVTSAMSLMTGISLIGRPLWSSRPTMKNSVHGDSKS